MRTFRQKNNNIKIYIHSGDIDEQKATQILTNIASSINLNSNWYSEANLWAKETTNKYNISIEQVAKITAILSPLCKWELNKIKVLQVLDAWQHGEKISVHFGKNMDKVYSVLENENKTDEQLFGPKTGEFYRNILNPDNTQNNAVIDSIACSILLDCADLPGSYKIAPTEFKKAQSIYANAAQKFNVSVGQLQAATWGYVREKRIKNKNITNLMLAEYDALSFQNSSINPYRLARIIKIKLGAK